MDTAENLEVTINTPDDCTWSCVWSWTYTGTQDLASVYEELEITDVYGTLIDIRREEPHSVEPGQVCSGGGPGDRLLERGNSHWSLRVMQGEVCLGSAGASFWAGRY